MHLRRFVLVRTVVPVLVSRRAAGLIFFVLFYGVWGDEDRLVFFVRVSHDGSYPLFAVCAQNLDFN